MSTSLMRIAYNSATAAVVTCLTAHTSPCLFSFSLLHLRLAEGHAPICPPPPGRFKVKFLDLVRKKVLQSTGTRFWGILLLGVGKRIQRRWLYSIAISS